MLPRPLAIGLAILISVLWAVNFVVGILYPGRSDPALNAIFALVAAAAVSQLGSGKVVKEARKRLADRLAPKPESDRDDRDDRGDTK